MMSSHSSLNSLNTSIFSGMQDFDDDLKSSKSLEILNTMMRILSSLRTIDSSQIERVYKMAAKDQKSKLSDNQKYYLLKQLSQFRSIKKIIFIQDTQSSSLQSPIALVQDQNGELILSRWSFDSDDRKDMQILIQSLRELKAKSAQIICLDKEEVWKYDNQKSFSSSSTSSLTQLSKAPPSLKNINLAPQVYISQPQDSFLTQTIQFKDHERKLFGSTQASISSLRGYNPSSHEATFLKNSQYQKTMSRKKDDREEDIQRVLEKLGKTKLHSPKLIEDYGEISYRELFSKLLSNPNSEKNRRWIEMFRDPISDRWNHYCLQALKAYFRKYE